MQRYDFIFVGRSGSSSDAYTVLRNDYLQRLKRYVDVRVYWIREQGQTNESKEIIKKIQEVDILIILDEKGKSLSSQNLARRLESWRDQGRRRYAFVIGGADGLAEEIKSRATWLFSLSELTLPHKLAHVLLLEQLYRSHTILEGEPYHRQ